MLLNRLINHINKILEIGITKMKTITIADQMLSLYAECVEGFIDSSGEKYDNLIYTISNDDIAEMIIKTPFYRQALNLGRILIDRGVFSNYASVEFNNAIAKAIEERKYYDKLLNRVNEIAPNFN